MRALTPNDMHLVAAGDASTSIYVTGTDPGGYHGYTPPKYGDGGGTAGGGGGSGGGGGLLGSGGYWTYGASRAANEFANQHVVNEGTTDADQHDYELAHDALAEFYDWATANPSELIYIGNEIYVAASTALADFSNMTFHINDIGGGWTGANTQMSADYLSAVVTLNPSNTASLDYAASFGDAGTDYVIFHELGHVLNGMNGQVYATDEAAANSAGMSMELALGIPLMSSSPTYGFD